MTSKSRSPEDNFGLDCCRNLLLSTAFFPAQLASKHVTPTADEIRRNKIKNESDLEEALKVKV
jgi:hypothetical protein